MAAEKTLVYRAYKEGHAEGQKELIIKLLKVNASIELISKATNLSPEEIQTIMEK